MPDNPSSITPTPPEKDPQATPKAHPTETIRMPRSRDSEEESPQAISVSVNQRFHQGPLPPPEVLVLYNEAVANGAERIMAMAEQEQEHRHALEKAHLEAERDLQSQEIKGTATVQIINAGGPVTIVLTTLALTYALATNGQPEVAKTVAAIIGTAYAAAAGAFAYGKARNPKAESPKEKDGDGDEP